MGTIIALPLIIVPITISWPLLITCYHIITYFNKRSRYRNTRNVVALNFKPSLLYT